MRRPATPAIRLHATRPDPRLRTVDLWRCADGHEFGVDADRMGARRPVCPTVVGQATNGRWLGCPALTQFVSKGGPVRPDSDVAPFYEAAR